jgi:hypothetical protein
VYGVFLSASVEGGQSVCTGEEGYSLFRILGEYTICFSIATRKRAAPHQIILRIPSSMTRYQVIKEKKRGG